MKAVIFCADRQNESAIAEQERICAAYAQRQGWKVVARYEDKGSCLALIVGA